MRDRLEARIGSTQVRRLQRGQGVVGKGCRRPTVHKRRRPAPRLDPKVRLGGHRGAELRDALPEVQEAEAGDAMGQVGQGLEDLSRQEDELSASQLPLRP